MSTVLPVVIPPGPAMEALPPVAMTPPVVARMMRAPVTIEVPPCSFRELTEIVAGAETIPETPLEEVIRLPEAVVSRAAAATELNPESVP